MISSEQIEFYNQCAKDVTHFASVVGYSLSPLQKDLVNGVDVLMGRQTGKTTALSIKIAHELIFGESSTDLYITFSERFALLVKNIVKQHIINWTKHKLCFVPIQCFESNRDKINSFSKTVLFKSNRACLKGLIIHNLYMDECSVSSDQYKPLTGMLYKT